MATVGGGGWAGKFGEFPYGDVDGMHVNAAALPPKCEPWFIECTTAAAADGDLICDAVELCSDLIDCGVCDDFIEWFSPKRFDAGGVCVPPVITLDELESSSPSLSYVCGGDFSSKFPWT